MLISDVTSTRLGLFTDDNINNNLLIPRTRGAVHVRNLAFEIMQQFEDNVFRFCATLNLQLWSFTLVSNRRSCYCP
jgi:hypothetical protein